MDALDSLVGRVDQVLVDKELSSMSQRVDEACDLAATDPEETAAENDAEE